MGNRIIVTGGAGFIGSAVSRDIIENSEDRLLVIDKLTYAGNLDSLAPVANNDRFSFVRADVTDKTIIRETLASFQPDLLIHLAAETHVDRSIDSPGEFIQTNIVGTYTLLQAAHDYCRRCAPDKAANFRFLHVSTDEVFGSLGADGLFTEDSSYKPNSPYAASKASADHLVRAWHHTFGFPAIISNCSNNYGPYHFPEKLIPLTILNALEGIPISVYGNGNHVRDWLYVEDHARALTQIAKHGKIGDTYNIGGNNERTNIAVVREICRLIDELAPNAAIGSRERLICFVPDRPGHDLRYAIDSSKIARDLRWQPKESFATGLRKTVCWYLENRHWWERIRSGVYHGERLGVSR